MRGVSTAPWPGYSGELVVPSHYEIESQFIMGSGAPVDRQTENTTHNLRMRTVKNRDYFVISNFTLISQSSVTDLKIYHSGMKNNLVEVKIHRNEFAAYQRCEHVQSTNHSALEILRIQP